MFAAYCKNEQSLCSYCDINSNKIPADITTKLNTFLSEKEELKLLIELYSDNHNDKAAIKLENGNMKIFTSKTIGQDYFIKAIADSELEIDVLEYLSPSQISTIVTVQSSQLIVSNSNLKTIQLTTVTEKYLFDILVGSKLRMVNTTFDTIEIPIFN